MKKKVEGQQGCSRTKTIILTTIITLLMIFVIFPLILLIFGEEKIGNVALIPITGVITTDGSSYLGSGTTSISASLLGRNSIGIEILPEYYDIAIERFYKETNKKPSTTTKMLERIESNFSENQLSLLYG